MVGASKGIAFGNALAAEMKKQENHCLVKVMMDQAVNRDMIR
jgi:hypothetical protein